MNEEEEEEEERGEERMNLCRLLLMLLLFFSSSDGICDLVYTPTTRVLVVDVAELWLAPLKWVVEPSSLLTVLIFFITEL